MLPLQQASSRRGIIPYDGSKGKNIGISQPEPAPLNLIY